MNFFVNLFIAALSNNQRPADYESAALPTELHQLINFLQNPFIAILNNNQRPADYEVYPGAEPAAVQWLAAKVKAGPLKNDLRLKQPEVVCKISKKPLI